MRGAEAPKPSDDLSDQSVYNSMGYNVNQEENLTSGERKACHPT